MGNRNKLVNKWIKRYTNEKGGGLITEERNNNEICKSVMFGVPWNPTKPNPACFSEEVSRAFAGRRKPQLGCLSQADEQTGNSTFPFFYRRFLTRSGFSPFMLLENNESKIKRRKGSGKGARLHAEMGEQAMESLILKFKETQSEVNFFFSSCFFSHSCNLKQVRDWIPPPHPHCTFDWWVHWEEQPPSSRSHNSRLLRFNVRARWRAALIRPLSGAGGGGGLRGIKDDFGYCACLCFFPPRRSKRKAILSLYWLYSARD